MNIWELLTLNGFVREILLLGEKKEDLGTGRRILWENGFLCRKSLESRLVLSNAVAKEGAMVVAQVTGGMCAGSGGEGRDVK